MSRADDNATPALLRDLAKTPQTESVTPRTHPQSAAKARDRAALLRTITQLRAALQKAKEQAAAQAPAADVSSLQKQIVDLNTRLTTAVQQKVDAENILKKTQDAGQIKIAALTKKLEQATAMTRSQSDPSQQRVRDMAEAKINDLTKQLKSAKERAAAALVEKQKKLDDESARIVALTGQLNAVNERDTIQQKTLDSAKAEVTSLTRQLKASADNSTRTADTQQQALDAAKTKIADLTQQLSALQEKPKSTFGGMTTPMKADEIRDYSFGASLGDSMKIVLQNRIALGVPLDRRRVADGVTDSLNETYKLPRKTIDQAVVALQATLEQKASKLAMDIEKQGKEYQATFSQQPDVKKSPAGFWYHIDYVGSGEIGQHDSVEMVLKESLSTGKVITDMDLNHSSLIYPLDRYPPLFRAALSLLKNHGSLTIVVPPEKAYGAHGAPGIPPGATMVYTIRIANVRKL